VEVGSCEVQRTDEEIERENKKTKTKKNRGKEKKEEGDGSVKVETGRRASAPAARRRVIQTSGWAREA
jgi:hypothetical protein